MNSNDWKIVYLTAGAGGMYCGSCLHDNTLAREMSRRGIDIQLVPTYTPIRTDEESVAEPRVFFGGIHVYLQHKFPWLGKIPGLTWLLDQPWLLRWATSKDVSTDPKELGGLAVSMLKGRQGVLGSEVEKLGRWLRDEVQPNLIVLSNMLIGGCVPDLKAMTGATLVVTLQGDDIFLNDLPEPHRTNALREIHRLVEHVDGFIVNSRYYADFMADLFHIERHRIHVVPLGIDIQELEPGDTPSLLTVGYLARLAPEKGLHLLVDAFLKLRQMPGTESARLKIAGWLGERNRDYAEAQFQKLRSAGLGDQFEYLGSVDRQGKRRLLQQIEILSVPTTYREPKGLFVLEALACGVPVIQPRHGAFPEMLDDLGGGRLFIPGDTDDLARELHRLLVETPLRRELAAQGMRSVRERRNAAAMVDDTLRAFAVIREGSECR